MHTTLQSRYLSKLRSPRLPHHTFPVGQDSPVSCRHFRYSNRTFPPWQNRGCLRPVIGSRVREILSHIHRRSFLASIPILTPVLSLKIRKRFFRLHPFHNRLHINLHPRKIGPPPPLHYPEPLPLIETHTFRLGIHSKVPAAYYPGH